MIQEEDITPHSEGSTLQIETLQLTEWMMQSILKATPTQYKVNNHNTKDNVVREAKTIAVRYRPAAFTDDNAMRAMGETDQKVHVQLGTENFSSVRFNTPFGQTVDWTERAVHPNLWTAEPDRLNMVERVQTFPNLFRPFTTFQV